MVKVEFIDGTSETVESIYVEGSGNFEYRKETQMFKVFHQENNGTIFSIMYPREFVKSIRHIEVSDD